MTVILRIVRGTVAAALTSAALAACAVPAGAQGIPMVTSAKAAANKAAAASNAQTAAMQNTNAASPANPAKPSATSATPSTTPTSVAPVRTTTVTGFSAPAPHGAPAAPGGQDGRLVGVPVADEAGRVGWIGAGACVRVRDGDRRAGEGDRHGRWQEAAVAATGPLSDSAGKSISVTQRGTRGEVSLNREVYSYDAGARRDPFVSLDAVG